MNTIAEIKEKIKEFTQRKPPIGGNFDYEYKQYLAKCSRLYEIDKELVSLELCKDEEIYQLRLKDIRERVEKIVKD